MEADSELGLEKVPYYRVKIGRDPRLHFVRHSVTPKPLMRLQAQILPKIKEVLHPLEHPSTVTLPHIFYFRPQLWHVINLPHILQGPVTIGRVVINIKLRAYVNDSAA